MSPDRIAYSVREAAEATGLSEAAIRRAYRSGQLVVHHVTNNVTILRSDLEAWISSAPTDRVSA